MHALNGLDVLYAILFYAATLILVAGIIPMANRASAAA